MKIKEFTLSLLRGDFRDVANPGERRSEETRIKCGDPALIPITLRRDPVFRNCLLSRWQVDLARAHQLVQAILEFVLHLRVESGPDMKQFPKPENFSSWSGVAPGNNESAGIKKRAPAMKGNPQIKVALVESGWAAS
jgi:hypothetical protein